jgi:hypothetical protein
LLASGFALHKGIAIGFLKATGFSSKPKRTILTFGVVTPETPFTHRIVVPAHAFLRIGTLNAILTAVARHKDVSKEEILEAI